MKHEQLIELIDKYLAGDCTPGEASIVEQWYASHRQTKDNFYQGDKTAIRESAARSLSAIRSRLHLEEEARIGMLSKRRVMIKWLAAACIVILFSAGTLVYFTNKQQVIYTIVQTGTGQIKHVTLPDGTHVWLNAGSILKYSSAYNHNSRQVDLDGEAFFDVVYDKDKPFNIHSGKIKTRVLGTAFSVSAYASSLVTTVTVVRGKVQVSDARHVLSDLLPDQELEYIASSGKSSVIHVKAEKVVSWKSGKLAFIDMPMQDIAVRLQKWYGVNFIFKNQRLKHTRFTASFNNTISLKDLLAVMYEVSHVSYHIDAKTGTVTYL